MASACASSYGSHKARDISNKTHCWHCNNNTNVKTDFRFEQYPSLVGKDDDDSDYEDDEDDEDEDIDKDSDKEQNSRSICNDCFEETKDMKMCLICMQSDTDLVYYDNLNTTYQYICDECLDIIYDGKCEYKEDVRPKSAYWSDSESDSPDDKPNFYNRASARCKHKERYYAPSCCGNKNGSHNDNKCSSCRKYGCQHTNHPTGLILSSDKYLCKSCYSVPHYFSVRKR